MDRKYIICKIQENIKWNASYLPHKHSWNQTVFLLHTYSIHNLSALIWLYVSPRNLADTRVKVKFEFVWNILKFNWCVNHFFREEWHSFFIIIIVVYCFKYYFYSRQSIRNRSVLENVFQFCKILWHWNYSQHDFLLSSCICLCPTTCENVIRTPSY